MVYTKADKENQRDTWARFNKLFGVIALAMFLVAVLSIMWVGVDAAFFWVKVGITLGVLVLVSILTYAAVYGVFVEWLASDVYDD